MTAMTRTALVTGGAKGIGRAIARDLAARGWNIAIAYRASEAAAGEVVAEARGRGVRALAVRADCAVPEQCEALVRQVAADLAPPDALVHCVGPYHRVDILKETPDGWRDMFASNLDS